MRTLRLATALLLFALPAGWLLSTSIPQTARAGIPRQEKSFDLVIRNGRVMDPETRRDQPGTNVGVRAGRIEAVTREPLAANQVIDAAGMVVTPGFIDLVSYDPNPVGAWNKIADGVTTNLALHGGTTDPASWYGHYEKYPPPVNYGASFFYSVARNELQISPFEHATAAQITQLAARADRALREGALAVSFSLEYVPGIATDEILPQMRLARRYGVPVFFHARYSTMEGPGTNIDALREIIEDCRQTGAAVNVEHIVSTGGTFSMPESLRMLEAARAEGLDITADAYPYTYWGTHLDSARFAPGWQQRFHITFSDLQMAGTSERLTAESFERYRRTHRIAVAYAIPEQDVVAALRSPFVMLASDGILEPGNNNHPRASGTFSRTLAVYVREKKVLTLMDALEKMTFLPARRMERSAPAFQRKGRIAPGADADIVVFDPQRVRDAGTVEHPELPAEGISWVLVGGTVVKSPTGLNKHAHPGQPLRGERDARMRLAAQPRPN
jgi:dihydroorotase